MLSHRRYKTSFLHVSTWGLVSCLRVQLSSNACRAQLKKDAQLAAAAPDETARAALVECYDRGGSVNELLETVCRVYGARNVFGSSVDGAANFTYITYAQLWDRVKTLAAGMAISAVINNASLHHMLWLCAINYFVLCTAFM